MSIGRPPYFARMGRLSDARRAQEFIPCQTCLPSYRHFTGRSAENYQRDFVPLIATPVSKDLLLAAALLPGERVLDVACGTGHIARAAAERVGSTGTVTGVDIAPDMIEVAQSVPYCFEHNGVMAHVLAQLGFEVDVLGGRVVWMNTSGELPAQTHQALAVTVPGDGGRYLVDVGFGGQTLSSPIRFETDTVQQTRHEPYRIR